MTAPKIKVALDKYIESVTDEREPDGKYHPSSMFLCNRQAIYGVRGVTPTNPPDSLSKRRFYIGHRLHEAVQRAMESHGDVKEFWPEFVVDAPDENIKGAGDGLIITDDDEIYILEVKSTKRIAIKYGLPKEEHKKQAKVYAWAVKWKGVTVTDGVVSYPMPPQGDRVKGIIIAYLEKEELDVIEYFLPYEDQWDEDILEQINELDVYREDEESLPPRLPLTAKGTKPWPCNYCPFKDKCWRVDPTEVEPKEPF